MVESGLVASRTLERLETYLSERRLRAGDRLPAERVLSAALGVSRTELRKALAVLEGRGALFRRVGHGTYLRTDETANAAEAALVDAAGSLSERTSPYDAMTARLAIEPELAGLAAVHARPAQLTVIRRLAADARCADGWSHYERIDFSFHAAIAEATGNALLMEVYRLVNGVRMAVLWPRLDVPEDGPPEDYHSFAEHDTIVGALDRRDRAGAMEAMRTHLKSTRASLVPEG